jgi:hypothetical protein
MQEVRRYKPSWATDALTHGDTTVSALPRHIVVDCTRRDAIEREATLRLADRARLQRQTRAR